MTARFLIPVCVLLCVGGLATATVAAQEGKPAAHVCFKIIQVDPQEPAGAKMLSAWNAEVANQRRPAENKRDQPADPTDRTSGKDTGTFGALVCDADQLFGALLNGSEETNTGGKLLSAPSLATYIAQEANITVGRQVPFMVKQDDGSLIIDHSQDLLEGIVANVKISDLGPASSGDGPLCTVEFHLKISRVTGRQPIADVPFDVGRPIISSQETASKLRLASGTEVVMRLPQPDQDDQPMFVVLAVKIIEKQEQ